MICPSCGSEDTVIIKTKIKCRVCGAENPVKDALGRVIRDDARGILLDAKAVARYYRENPPGIV